MKLGVELEARIREALFKGDDLVEVVDAAGACAAVDRVRGGPAEEVQLFAGLKGEHAVFIFEHDEAFLGDLKRNVGSFLCGRLGDGAAAGRKRDQGGHGAEADHVDGHNDGEKRRDPGFLADEASERLLLLSDCDGHDEREHQCDADGDEVGSQAREDSDQVFHFK